MAITVKKQPQDVLDYDIDLADWFYDAPGDDIQSVSHTVTSPTEDSPALVVGPSPHDAIYLIGAEPVKFKVWLGGGTDQTDYTVNLLVLTEQDRKKEVELRVKVRDEL